jgi:cytochrome c oxidase subunit IV
VHGNFFMYVFKKKIMVFSMWFCPKQKQSSKCSCSNSRTTKFPEEVFCVNWKSALSTSKIYFLVMFLKVDSYECNRGGKWLLNFIFIKFNANFLKNHLHDIGWKWISLLFLLVYFPISSHLFIQVMKNNWLKFLAMQKLLNFEYFYYWKFNEIKKF